MKSQPLQRTPQEKARLGRSVPGKTQTIGKGFQALHFSADMFGGAMDPLLMVDHFVMTAPTFEPHLHAGISAVSALFEDTQGRFLNRDSLGHNVALEPGDLYWLAAASGAAHDERPADGARIHALQIFVDLPHRLKMEPPRAQHVQATAMPVITGKDHRVRVLVGATGHIRGAHGTPEEMTMLDGSLAASGTFDHELPQSRQAWIYAVKGDIRVALGNDAVILQAGNALTISAGPSVDIALSSIDGGQFFLAAARPIGEAHRE
jgi:redox-sensitive bicupin YhaK (pirin superfamily)